jgi:hypothetical protein
VSPLFVYLAGRWNLIGKKSRIFLLLISPLMLLILLIGVIFIGDAVLEYQRIQRFADNDALERITGAPFPKLKVVEFKEGKVSFNGDFTDNWVVKMKDGAGESLFLYLDSVANKKGTNWFKDEEKYFYNRIWGNGYPAPNGEDDEEDRFLYISLKKDCNTIIIQSGMW